jgi:hypothetical protein
MGLEILSDVCIMNSSYLSEIMIGHKHFLISLIVNGARYKNCVHAKSYDDQILHDGHRLVTSNRFVGVRYDRFTAIEYALSMNCAQKYLKIMVLWDMTPTKELAVSIFRIEYRDRIFLRNVSIHLINCIA